MPHIVATDRPLLWAVTQADRVVETGLTQIGDLTVTGLTIISAPDENAFLGAVAGKGGAYKPLPDAGWLEAGEIYGHGGGLVIIRQSHNRTEHRPEDIPALMSVYRPDAAGALDWVANEKVERGMRRMYAGKTWECRQSHTTQSDWTPPQTPALWAEVVEVPPEPEIPDWRPGVAYKGDNTAGAGKGDVVKYQGVQYRCWQSHTSLAGWEPPNVPALWIRL